MMVITVQVKSTIKNMPKVLITGATGFIGGSVAISLFEAGYEVVGIDYVKRPHMEKYFSHFIYGDFESILDRDFAESQKFDAIVHCAGTSLVGPSTKNPSEYYHNNVIKTVKLLEWIRKYLPKCHLLFSSTGSVYKEKDIPLREYDIKEPVSPYSRTKRAIEYLVEDYKEAYNLKVTIFRYFNACGSIGSIHGQDPKATHIFARLFESYIYADPFDLYGDDYDTPDGTCIRDYIHVRDLAYAHQLAIEIGSDGIYNVGSGTGYSNQEIINRFEIDFSVDVHKARRRKGDATSLVADISHAKKKLGWEPKHGIDDIIYDLNEWYNSNNYRGRVNG